MMSSPNISINDSNSIPVRCWSTYLIAYWRSFSHGKRKALDLDRQLITLFRQKCALWWMLFLKHETSPWSSVRLMVLIWWVNDANLVVITNYYFCYFLESVPQPSWSIRRSSLERNARWPYCKIVFHLGRNVIKDGKIWWGNVPRSHSVNYGMFSFEVLYRTNLQFWQYKQGVSTSGKELANCYVNFVRNCMEQLRSKILDELWVLNLLEQWYSTQVNMICTWLTERVDCSLHSVQLIALSHIVRVSLFSLFYIFYWYILISFTNWLNTFFSSPSQKVYSDFALQGLEEEKLNSKAYQTILSRMQMEDAAASVNGSSRDEDE